MIPVGAGASRGEPHLVRSHTDLFRGCNAKFCLQCLLVGQLDRFAEFRWILTRPLSDETNVPHFDQSADNSVSTDRVHEEYFNAVTHGFGLLLTLIGAIAIFALGRTGDHGETIAGQVYLVTLVAVYGISTLSHWVQKPRLKLSLQTWDQGTIYLLIAGTYTPFVWKYVGIEWRWLFLSVIWAVALLGFSSKVLARYRVLKFSSNSYVLFGWLPALAMVNLVPWICVIWMALGGISYTVGTFFLWLDHRYRYFHAIWHLFVIVGSALHYYAIYRLILLPNAMG